MTATYDQDADAFYVRFSTAMIDESEEVRPGVTLDFDAEGGSSRSSSSTRKGSWLRTP
jgi:uncharacterized protein YuzE